MIRVGEGQRRNDWGVNQGVDTGDAKEGKENLSETYPEGILSRTE